MYMYTYMRVHVRMDVFRLGFSLPHTRAHVFVDLAWPPQLKWLAIRHFLAQVCMYACPGTTVDSMRYNVLTYIHVWYQGATVLHSICLWPTLIRCFPPPFSPTQPCHPFFQYDICFEYAFDTGLQQEYVDLCVHECMLCTYTYRYMRIHIRIGRVGDIFIR